LSSLLDLNLNIQALIVSWESKRCDLGLLENISVAHLFFDYAEHLFIVFHLDVGIKSVSIYREFGARKSVLAQYACIHLLQLVCLDAVTYTAGRAYFIS
jgi:hypothetical protein